MQTNSNIDPSTTPTQPWTVGRLFYFLIALCPAILALLAPFSEADIRERLGFLLVITALLELTHGFRRAHWQDQKHAWASGAISLALGSLLMNAPFFATQSLQFLIAGWFSIDVVRNLIIAAKSKTLWKLRLEAMICMAGNLTAMLAVVLVPESWLEWILAVATAARIFQAALSSLRATLMSPEFSAESVTADLGFAPGSKVDAIVHEMTSEESSRSAIDRSWIISFVLVLLAIHVGRMGFDRTFLGIMGPGFAVLGDMFAALLLAFLIFIPILISTNRLTRRIESAGWRWCTDSSRSNHGISRVIRSVLAFRLRLVIRLRLARCSLSAAISRGLQMGLPVTAVIAATAPIWGMSWYFDTENWAAGIWNSWAAQRTDVWREAMVTSVIENTPPSPIEQRFHVNPPPTVPGDDFAFLVIGDTGEGDASQHILRSEFLKTVQREDVRFVVISSDVIYPTGAMRDYESKFWLPFMGTEKPVYAIPGNHDWYDALEGFVATFFEPEAARIAMRARVDADNNITTTTDSRIEELIATATRLRSEYRVPTQFQQAPYFQFQTDSFALFAVDTGVIRGIDDIQKEWLEVSLKSAEGKTKMVVLGHPFFAGGIDTTIDDPDFLEIRTLFQRHNVSIVMAGDTHDLEYYREPLERPSMMATGSASVMHHFVNGGGGAYLSFGTSLAWPSGPVTEEWQIYPSRSDVESKIEATAPLWKRPAWFWTTKFGGWPFSAEWLSAAFDVNAAPYYQSFVEIRVEATQKRLRLIPHGIHGPLRYGDMQMSEPTDADWPAPDAPVEWIIPMVTP